MRRLSVLLLLTLTAGCADLIEQLQSEQIAIATLLSTPETTGEDPEETIPGVTTFTLFFGNIDRSLIAGGDAEEGAFSGISDAEVELLYKDAEGKDQRLTPEKKGEGQYHLDSATSQLSYASTKYRLNIRWSGKTYRLEVEPPKGTQIAEFSEHRILTGHTPGASFTVTRADPAAQTKDNAIAFVSANALSGDEEQEAWTNMPSDALGLLRLLLADSPWRQNAFQIPGATFKAGTEYLLSLSAMERGLPTGPADGSAALFIGSSFLAGQADAGILQTK